jgi:glucoselysine-6-phosphate deglycase
MKQAIPTMMTYINEEQEIFEKILKGYPENVPTINGKNWLILATGSSINAAFSAKYYIEKITDVHIAIEEPFKFNYYEKMRPEIDVVIGVSQSGESTSTINALKKISQEHPEITRIGLTGKVDSELATIVETVIDIENGEERVGYVTKGFSATILKLMLTGLKTAVQANELTPAQEAKELQEFQTAITQVPAIISKTEAFFDRWATQFVQASRFTALCCGSALGAALEMQTKFCETVRVPSQGLDIEVFMHGPYLEVNPNHQLFFIETNSPVNDRLLRLREYEAQHVKNVYTVTLNKSKNERTLGLDLAVDEYKAPLFVVIPFQILAHHIAEALGNNLPKRIYTDFGVAMSSKTKPGDYA